MRTASEPHTPPTRRTTIGMSIAALAAGLSAPALASTDTRTPTRIAALNRRLQNVSAENLRLDEAAAGMSSGAEKDAMDADFFRTLDEIRDLRDQIAKLPAQTLDDAAVQSAIAFFIAEGLNEFMDGDEIAAASRSLRTVAASMLTALAKATDRKIDDVAEGMGYLCSLYAPGGKCAA